MEYGAIHLQLLVHGFRIFFCKYGKFCEFVAQRVSQARMNRDRDLKRQRSSFNESNLLIARRERHREKESSQNEYIIKRRGKLSKAHIQIHKAI